MTAVQLNAQILRDMAEIAEIVTTEARQGLAKLERDEPEAFAKAVRFIEELKQHPKTGLGHPEPLKGMPEGR